MRLLFLSTSPLRGTTVPSLSGSCDRHYFYPRPPCGGRLAEFCRRENAAAFLSTSPLRGTTGPSSSMALHTGIFLSTSPLRGTTGRVQLPNHLMPISIHVPLAGDDLRFVRRQVEVFVFLSTSPLRGTTEVRLHSAGGARFLSTSPLRGTTCRFLGCNS